MDNNYNQEIALSDIVSVLWKNKITIIAITLASTIIAIVFALNANVIYSSNTIFITKTSNSNSSNISSLASLAGIPIGNNSNNIDPSDYLDKVLLDKNFLSEILMRKWFYNGDSLFLDQIFKIKKDTTQENWKYRYEKAKIDFLRKNELLYILKEKKSGLLTLTTNMPSPQLAYDINTFVIEQISDYIRNSLKSQAKEKRLFIQERILEVKSDLEKSENALALFKERNIMSSAPKVMLEEMRLTRAVTMNQEIFIQFKKQYELARIEELNDQTLIQILKSPEIPIKPVAPNRLKITVLGTLIGAFLSIFIVLILSLKNNFRK